VNWIDIAIGATLLLAIVFGLVKGFVRPILLEAGFLVALLFASSHQADLDKALGPALGVRGMPLVLLATSALTAALFWPARLLAGALLRVPGLGAADPAAGAAVHGLLAFAFVYLVASALVTMGRALDPLLAARGPLSPAQIHAFANATGRDPILHGLVDSAALQRLENEAGRGPVTFRQLERSQGMVDFYVRVIRLPLQKSQVTPAVLRLGEHLPVIGKRVELL
jgi:uncharacterized membrane protein required for colicin V production